MEKVEEQYHTAYRRRSGQRKYYLSGLYLLWSDQSVEEEPYVMEYNCRMGDPETEVVIPRLQNDLLELFSAVQQENLGAMEVYEDPRTATTVMLVSAGYPESLTRRVR